MKAFKPEYIPGAPSPQEMQRIQRENAAVRMDLRESVAARDLMKGSGAGEMSSEDVEKKSAAEAQRQAEAREAFGEELAQINRAIAEVKGEIGKQQKIVEWAQGKLAAADSAEAQGIFTSSMERARAKITELQTTRHYGDNTLEELEASREALEKELAELASKDEQPN